MSGAASIAAAKNRRSKPDPNQKPIITCSTKPGSSSNNKTPQPNSKMTNNVFDEESLQITGPMPLLQVLKVHEQRLNKIDEKIAMQLGQMQLGQVPVQGQLKVSTLTDDDTDERLQTLEEKVQMLEEVIMNLQLTLANVQSFAMETSLAMLKLQNTQCPPMASLSPLTTEPLTAAPVPEPIVLAITSL